MKVQYIVVFALVAVVDGGTPMTRSAKIETPAAAEEPAAKPAAAAAAEAAPVVAAAAAMPAASVAPQMASAEISASGAVEVSTHNTAPAVEEMVEPVGDLGPVAEETLATVEVPAATQAAPKPTRARHASVSNWRESLSPEAIINGAVAPPLKKQMPFSRIQFIVQTLQALTFIVVVMGTWIAALTLPERMQLMVKASGLKVPEAEIQAAHRVYWTPFALWAQTNAKEATSGPSAATVHLPAACLLFLGVAFLVARSIPAGLFLVGFAPLYVSAMNAAQEYEENEVEARLQGLQAKSVAFSRPQTSVA